MLVIFKPYHKDDGFTCLSHKCVKVIKIPKWGEILFSKQIEDNGR